MKPENEILRRVLSWLPEILSAAGIGILLAVGIRGYLFMSPCRIETDCRGLDISVEQMKTWEEQEKGGYNGILDMAGWRTEKQQTVTAVSTGRSKVSGIVAVYGSASLVYPAKILAGDYALPYADGSGGAAAGDTAEGTLALSWHLPACILSAELSDALFGSTDTAGELVKAGGELLAVAGVIDKEGVFLLRRADSGQIEYAAFRMSRRYQAEAKARQRVGASY